MSLSIAGTAPQWAGLLHLPMLLADGGSVRVSASGDDEVTAVSGVFRVSVRVRRAGLHVEGSGSIDMPVDAWRAVLDRAALRPDYADHRVEVTLDGDVVHLVSGALRAQMRQSVPWSPELPDSDSFASTTMSAETLARALSFVHPAVFDTGDGAVQLVGDALCFVRDQRVHHYRLAMDLPFDVSIPAQSVPMLLAALTEEKGDATLSVDARCMRLCCPGAEVEVARLAGSSTDVESLVSYPPERPMLMCVVRTADLAAAVHRIRQLVQGARTVRLLADDDSLTITARGVRDEQSTEAISSVRESWTPALGAPHHVLLDIDHLEGCLTTLRTAEVVVRMAADPARGRAPVVFSEVGDQGQVLLPQLREYLP